MANRLVVVSATGCLGSALGTDYLAVPYQEDKDNQNAKMEIGYIQPKNTELDEIGETFLREMKAYLGQQK